VSGPLGRNLARATTDSLKIRLGLGVLAETTDPLDSRHAHLQLRPEQDEQFQIARERDDLGQRDAREASITTTRRRRSVPQPHRESDNHGREPGDDQVQDYAKPLLDDVHEVPGSLGAVDEGVVVRDRDVGVGEGAEGRHAGEGLEELCTFEFRESVLTTHVVGFVAQTLEDVRTKTRADLLDWRLLFEIQRTHLPRGAHIVRWDEVEDGEEERVAQRDPAGRGRD